MKFFSLLCIKNSVLLIMIFTKQYYSVFTKKGRAMGAGSWCESKITFPMVMSGSSEPHSVLGVSVILRKSLTICRENGRMRKSSMHLKCTCIENQSGVTYKPSKSGL